MKGEGMKIILDAGKNVSYYDLETGDMFKYNDEVYMKTDIRDDRGVFYAIQLENGRRTCFSEVTDVYRVDGELRVKTVGG